MKLLSILLTAILCATASAQTIKSLGYNSTNGQVVANTGTNMLTFTNSIKISTDITLTEYGILGGGYSGEIDFEENQLTAGDGDWNLEGSGFVFAGQISFLNSEVAATTRTNLGLPLAALTNTSNVTMMRALSGSTNTNEPYSGSISVVGTNNTNTLVFSNGILQSVQ